MGDTATHKRRVQEQFGGSAAGYVASPGHAAGGDLAHLAAWAAAGGGPDRRALDIATGGGHTALAVARGYGRVVAADLTPRMLATARAFVRGQGAENVAFVGADAERLPFGDAAFDLVTCRIAPHHFDDVARFVAEVARVLRPGGRFLLIDNIAPEDPDLDAFLNRAEALRDPTHVRALTASRWRALLAGAGLTIEEETIFTKIHPFDAWLDRARVPADRRPAVVAAFRDAPPAARDAFAIAVAPDGRVESYTSRSLALKAQRGPRTEDRGLRAE